jgi:BirA family transcriptional regulator, biotin operon repressor / biotin---[acetyl-CoA-carboxylase] ligase
MTSPGLSLDARLLRCLRNGELHWQPADLAHALGEPREMVADAIERLLSAGFDIENKPGLGWRLVGSPDRLIADDLFSRMRENGLVREIVVFAETNSTNDVAVRMGREGHPGGVVVFAEKQTAGRGRFGRRWESAGHAGLWFSILLRPNWPVAHWPRLTTAVAVAVSKAIEEFSREKVRLKWPNDLLIREKKLGGILIETATDVEGRLFAVAGVGLNVNQAEFSPEIAEIAGSLRQANGSHVDRPALAAAVLAALGEAFPNAGTERFIDILAEARERSAVLGSWVRLHVGAEAIEGMAEDLNGEGQLILRLATGELRTMSAGEVTSRATPRDH